ncbi:MAG: tetratricopeptide repeat protein [Planctomycetota bacterium]
MAATFGKYTLEKKLGQGGMGAVYLALDPALNRKVALKVITSKDEKLLERFQREASAVAKLKHPNIVQVYEAGIINKQHYFTMDYVEGTPLDKLIQAKSKPSFQNIAKIILQVASALHYAHSQKIIHRDIKPGNILIDKNGETFLTDFGVAKQLTGLDRSLTITGTAIGTPNYMPPEQAQGKKDEIDPRSDIFSLGATLYHCLTGQMPFDGNEIYEVLSKVINEDPPAPSSIARIIPKDLETICLQCLNKDKSKRYQTAGALAQDLKQYLEGAPITARRTSYLARFRIKVKKNKMASLAITGAIVILITVVIGLMTSSAGKEKEIESYRTEAKNAFEKNDYDKAKEWSTKLLALAPDDETIKGILKKSEKIIKAQEDKKQQVDKQVKEAAAKAQRTVDLRAKAKEILERATGAPTPEQKIKLAQEALAIDSTFGDAYQVIGYAYKEKGDNDKAYEYFSKAIEATPTLAYSYYERAFITQYIRNKPDEAIADFEKVLELDPNSHIGWFAKGNIALNKQKYDDAIASFSKTIELYPEYDWAYNNRGNVYRAKGEIEQAIKDLNKAIELNPKFAEAYINRGSAYQDKDELDRAIADYNEALRLAPKLAPAYTNRGTAYQNKGELDKAIADYNEALRLDPKYANAYTTRGNAYAKKGELDRAIADHNEALRLDPKDTTAYTNRGIAYKNKGEIDRAIKDYDKAIELNPRYANAYTNRGNAYYKKGDLDRAIADWTKAIELNPKNANAYTGRGIAYADKKDYKRAIVDFEMVLKLAPNHPSVPDVKNEIERLKKEK